MERAAWPRSGFHSGASPKKNRLARPDKAMDGKSRPASVSWTPRASRTRTPLAQGLLTQARRCRESSVISRWDRQGLPHAIHVTTADVTDRAGALAMFDRRRDGLSQVQNVLVDGGYTGKPFATAVQGLLGAAVEVVKRNELHTSWCFQSDGWWSGLSPGWKSAADSGRTAKGSSIPACKWWCLPSRC